MKEHRNRKALRVKSIEAGALLWSYDEVHESDPGHTAEDMAAYDSLPPEIRKTLSEGAWDISPSLVKDAYDRGASQRSIVLQLMRHNLLLSLAYRKAQGWPP